MKRTARTFIVDEDDRLHSIPYARFERINGRKQRIHLYASRCIRVIFAVVEIDEKGAESLLHADFMLWVFDETGLLCEDHVNASLQNGVKLLCQNADWKEVHRIEYAERFCWKPSGELLSRLRRMIRDKRKRE
jgi:hypothetical protein